MVFGMDISALLTDITNALVFRVLPAIIVLIVGLIAGKVLGGIVERIVNGLRIDEKIKSVDIGRALTARNVTVAGILGLATRWYIYILALVAAADYLGIQGFRSIMERILDYVPDLVAGVLIIILGMIFADYLADYINSVAQVKKAEYGGVLATAVRFLLYFVVLVMGLAQMRLDTTILYTFAQAFIWSLAIGIGVGLGIAVGWGAKDKVAEYIEKLSGK